MYTIIDEETFDSQYVCLENDNAVKENVPIIPIYNKDSFIWENLVTYWNNKGIDIQKRFKMLPPYAYVSAEANLASFMHDFVDMMQKNGVIKRKILSDNHQSIQHGFDFPLGSATHHVGILCDNTTEYNRVFVDMFFEVCGVLGYKACLLDDNDVTKCKTVLVLLTPDLFKTERNKTLYKQSIGLKLPILSMYDSDANTFSYVYNLFSASYDKLFSLQAIVYTRLLNQYAIENFFRILCKTLNNQKN